MKKPLALLLALLLFLVLTACGSTEEPTERSFAESEQAAGMQEEITRNPAAELEPTPEPTPEPASSAATYVLNTNTHKFHHPWCSSVEQMKEQNKKVFEGTRDEIIAMGYEPCKRCNP